MVDPSENLELETTTAAVQPDLVHTFGQVLFGLPQFADTWLTSEERRPPYWLLLIWLLGIDCMVTRIAMRQTFGHGTAIDSWPKTWAAILLGGIFAGFVAYGVRGLLFHVFVRLAGGAGKLRQSLYLCVYCGLPIYLATIAITVLDCLFYGPGYFTSATNFTADMMELAFAAAAVLWATILAFTAARRVTGIKAVRGVLLFIGLPILLQVGIVAAMIGLAISRSEVAEDHNSVGNELSIAGDYEAAIDRYQRAIDSAAHDDYELLRSAHSNMGIAQEQNGDTDQAIAAYEAALRYGPDDTAEAMNLQASIHLLRNETREAAELLFSAIALDPDDFNVNNTLGLVLMGSYDDSYRDYERAESYNRRAYDLAPSAVTAEVLARNLYFLDRCDETLALAAERDEAGAVTALFQIYAGLCAYDLARFDLAVTYLELGVGRAPELKGEYVSEVLADLEARRTEP